MPVMGKMTESKDGLVFKGGVDKAQEQEQVEVGLFISNILFSEKVRSASM